MCNKLRVFNSASLRVSNFVYLTPLRSVYETSCNKLRFAPCTASKRLTYIYFLTALRAFLHEVFSQPRRGLRFLQPSGLLYIYFLTALRACIRFYDLLHEGVPYDVLLVKFYDGDAANVLQPLDGIAQS